MSDTRAAPQATEWTPAPDERPSMPGSPPTPWHPPHRRAAYAAVAVLVAMTGALGSAIVAANLNVLQGALGLSQVEAQWLPTAYVMTNVSINMLLIKFRQQYGLRLFTSIFLIGYVVATAAHLFVHSFASAVTVRAFSGMAGAATSTLALLYIIQAFTPAHRLKGIVLIVSLPQLAVPLARLFASAVVDTDRWDVLYQFELGLALLSLAAVRLLALPPTERMKVFEPLDFLSFALFAGGIALLCAVLGLGRTLWWTNAPWVGWALAGAVILIPIALTIEHYRARPLLATRWLGSKDILRFALVAILTRVVLSEQNIGAVGLLQTLGMGPEQLTGLFAVVLLATAAGVVVGTLTVDASFLGRPILIALLLIAAGSFLDADSTNLTRPHDMYLSQALLGFAGALFIGPALLVGLTRALQQGPSHFVSFSALFGITQNLGGLIGAALLGSFQVMRERLHSVEIVGNLALGDPLVAERVRLGAAAYARVIADPALRSAQGSAALSVAATREANVLAYNDVFLLVALIATVTLAWASVHIFRIRRENLARAAAARAEGERR